MTERPDCRVEKIGVLRRGYDCRCVRDRVFGIVCPAAAVVDALPYPAVGIHDGGGAVGKAGEKAVAGAAEYRRRGFPCHALVVGAPDKQIAVFGRAAYNIKRAAVIKQLSPEAGHKLAYIVPALPAVVGAEDKLKILRIAV